MNKALGLFFAVICALVILFSAVSSAAGYILGPGDVIQVKLLSPDPSTSDVVVRPDGAITVDLINDVYVAGLDTQAAADLIREKLTKLFVKPLVSVTIKQMRPINIKVLGEVSKPGPYPLKPESAHFLDAIAAAGGTVDSSDIFAITLTHSDGSGIQVINLDKATQETGNNPALVEGDTINVPKLRPITVSGAVVKPGMYYVSAHGVKLVELIALAGGFTDSSDTSRVRILDSKDQTKEVYNGPITSNPDTMPGSIVEVPTRVVAKVVKATPYLQFAQLGLAVLAAILTLSRK